MVTATETPPEQDTKAPPGVESLYRYSTWMHAGAGAASCEDAETGACGDPTHFHAWCRLPNQHQHREIREKALAAQARRVRQMRDPDTDACVILEADLDRIARLGEEARKDIIEELIGADWATDYLEATADVKGATEPDDDEKLVWPHIDEDRQRHAVLKAMNPDDRPNDEWTELEKRLAAFGQAIEDREEELQKPRREALEKKDLNALIDQLRDLRIDANALEEFSHTYNIWEWQKCTRRLPSGEAVWSEPTAMEDVAPEVIEALRATYDDLERTQREATSQGNS